MVVLEKSYNTYVKAFITSIFIFLLITICLILASISKNYYIGHISGWLLILGLINIFTFLRNITDLMRLNILFNIKVDEENRKQENK